MIRALPRVSTSSVPRGRSTSPFGRSNSAGKKDRVTARVSLDGLEVCKENQVPLSTLGVRSSEVSGNGSSILRQSAACEESELKVGDSSCSGTATATRTDINVEAAVASGERCGFEASGDVKNGDLMEKELEVKSSVREKPPNSSRILEKLKGQVSSSEGLKGEVSSKHQSRLHEKLAFLEGKVKRIASDIKKTKEMLDLNNPDESKIILSDVQEKISGIEKAMGHAIGDSGVKGGAFKETANDNRGSGASIEKIEGEVECSLKSSVKELSSEELEARLFPHHKLLRNRASLKTSKVEEKVTSMVEVKPSNLINKKQIAMEVLASLSDEQFKAADLGRQCGVEIHEDGEMDIASSSEAENKVVDQKDGPEIVLTTDETLDEFDDQENRKGLIIGEMNEDTCIYQPKEIGCKTTTGGWFVSEGDTILLVHSDGSCSYYDVANGEVCDWFLQMFVCFTEMLVFSDVLVSFYVKYWLITGVSMHLYS